MTILPIDKENIKKLNEYILNKDLKDYLNFYRIENNSDYFEIINRNISNSNSISLLCIDNDKTTGFVLGEISIDDDLKSKIAKLNYAIYDNLECYEKLLNIFQEKAKENKCEYVSVCTPKFQEDTLNILNSTGFKNYKVELEKELK